MYNKRSSQALASFVLLIISGCASDSSPSRADAAPDRAITDLRLKDTVMEGTLLKLTSTAFSAGQAIPAKHSCDGADVSPALAWTGAPSGTKSYALIMDDPDAPGGTFVHWVAYAIAPDKTGLPESVEKTGTVAGLCQQGTNSFNALGYGGPCPPKGQTHHYRFTLYALSEVLSLAAGIKRADLEAAMTGKVLAQSLLVGTFLRQL